MPSTTTDIILASLKSVINLFISASIGAGCVYTDIMTNEVIMSFSKLSYYVFLPCLIFSTIGDDITVEEIKYAWPLILVPTVIQVINYFIGNFLCRILNVSSAAFRRIIVLSLMFSNYGNFPYSIIRTITSEVSPFSEDPKYGSRGLAYSTLFVFTSGTALWSFGPWYLNSCKHSVGDDLTCADQSSSTQNLPLLEELVDSVSQDAVVQRLDYSDSLEPRQVEKEFLITKSVFQKFWFFIVNTCKTLYSFVTPTLVAVVISLIILFVKPLHYFFFNHNSNFSFITALIASLSNVYIPFALMILGADLFKTVRLQFTNYRLRKESKDVLMFGGISWKILLSVLFMRLLFLPALYFFLTWLILKPVLQKDALALIVVVIETSMPSALNLVILVHFIGIPHITEKLSVIILFQYLLCIIPIIIFVTLAIKVYS